MQSDNAKAGPSRPNRDKSRKFTDAELLQILENSSEESDVDYVESESDDYERLGVESARNESEKSSGSLFFIYLCYFFITYCIFR